MNRLLSILILVAGSLLAQTPTKIVDGLNNEVILGAGGKAFDSGISSVTTGNTQFASRTTKVQLLFCNNTSGAAVTVTVTDGQASPKTYWPAVSLAANSVVLMHASVVGLPMSDGIVITASANSAIQCQVVGVQ